MARKGKVKMKNLKKMVSGILTAAMLFTTSVTSYAAAKGDCTTEKWLIDHYGTLPQGFVENENFYTEPTTDTAYGESRFSMHFYNEAQDGYVTRIRDKQVIPAGTYYVSFYLKGSVTEGWTKAGLSKNMSMIATNGVWTKTPDGEWNKYEAELTTTAQSDGVYVTVNGGADFYMDNFVVCPVTDGIKGANILSNGDFEKSIQTLPAEPDEPEITSTPNEDYITEVWQEQYVAISEDYTAEKDIFAEPSTEESFAGEYSMHMVHPGSMTTTENDGYVRIMDIKKENNAAAISAGTYYISFYLKGKVAEGWTVAGVSDLSLNNSAWEKTAANNGWTKYEATITTTDASDRVRFRTYGNSDFYIDNFEVCPVTDGVKGENILSNGGFEKTRKAAAGLINPIIYPSVNGVSAILSWRNPNYGSVVSVEAFLNGGGFEKSELDLGELILTTGGNVGTTRTNTCLIQGLTNNTDYVLTLNTTINQNNVTTSYTTEIPFRTSTESTYNTIDRKMAGKWILSKLQTNAAYMNTLPAIDTDVKYSGNSSLRLDSNMFTRVNNIYAPVAQNLKLKRNKIYVLTFKAKLSGVNQLKAMVNGKSVNEIGGAVRTWAKQDYLEQNTNAYIFKDWTEYKYILSVDGEYPLFSESVETADVIDTTVTIFPEQMCGSMWIDEVGVYEIDSDDEICSGNLLKDGGMEFVSSEITTTFKDSNGAELNKIKPGTVNVTTAVRNISLGNDFNTATIIALYKGNSLCRIWTKEEKIAEIPDGIPTATWTQEVNVPDDGEKYTIKVMYWNSSSEITPIEALEELK